MTAASTPVQTAYERGVIVGKRWSRPGDATFDSRTKEHFLLSARAVDPWVMVGFFCDGDFTSGYITPSEIACWVLGSTGTDLIADAYPPFALMPEQERIHWLMGLIAGSQREPTI